MYDLAPNPPLLPSPLSQSFCVLPVVLTDERGGGWGGAKSYDAEKAWSSINHSTLFEVVHTVNSSRSFEYNFDNAINIKSEDPKARWQNPRFSPKA